MENFPKESEENPADFDEQLTTLRQEITEITEKFQTSNALLQSKEEENKELREKLLALEIAVQNLFEFSQTTGIQVRGQSKALELQSQPHRSKANVKAVFVLFCLLALIVNIDTGVIPAALFAIQDEIQMTFQEQANLGSLVFLGFCIGSLCVTPILQHYSASRALTAALFTNSIVAWLFSFSYHLYFLYITRFLMGFFRSFVVIYFPVWVNEFSPEEVSTQWLGMIQACTTLGVIIGYSVAGMIINFLEGSLTWRSVIQFQALFLLPLIIWLCAVDSSYIDIVSRRDRAKSIVSAGDTLPEQGKLIRIDTVSLSHFSTFLQHLKVVISTQLFVWVTLALCTMYFVVNGIQYWITLYLVQALGEKLLTVIIAFSIICVTAPMAGVVFGGWLSDHFGGYKGDNLVTALQLCVAFAIFASTFSIPIGFVGNLYYVCPLLWMMMFFGGCLVPTATGININSMTREYQSSASAVSQLFINLGAYLSPVISAAIMDVFDDPIYGLVWGFRAILFISVFGILFLVVAWVVSYLQLRKDGNYADLEEERDKVGGLHWYSNKEYQNELQRRRLHSLSF